MFTADPATLQILTPLARDFLNPEFLDLLTEEIWARLEEKLAVQFDSLVDRLSAKLSVKLPQIDLTKPPK